MEINSKLRSGNPEVDQYLSDLEDHILGWQASNIKSLIQSCDHMSGIVAEDIMVMAQPGDFESLDSQLKILGSKKKELYQVFKEVMREIKHFKVIPDLIEEMKPKVYTQEVKVPVIEEKVVIEEPVAQRPRNISDLALIKAQK